MPGVAVGPPYARYRRSMIQITMNRFDKRALCSAAAFTLLAASVGCSSIFHRGEPTGPELMLEKAITQAGGEQALESARALTWDGDATVTGGGRTVHITGKWAIEPPEKAVVSTYDVSAGPSTISRLVVNAPKGWIVRNGQFRPMPPSTLA